MLREMQKWLPRLLLIPSPPSSFNQTVNLLSVSYGFVAVPNCTTKVQGFANRVQDRLHTNTSTVLCESGSFVALLAKVMDM